MPATFDGTNLIITLPGTAGAGALTIDVGTELYSDWKEWFAISDNSKYPIAFNTVGGEDLTPGIKSGAYFFIRNDLGWRIRPAEEDATYTFVGNLAPQDSTIPILLPTVGNFRVLVNGLQPITQNVEGLIIIGKRLGEVYKRMGLDVADPWNVNITNGEEYTDSRDIEVAITGDGINSSRHVRQ